MVGIPGRSKACLSCLRRRKACDLRHPTCKQCERLKLECTWYKPQTIFVNATTKTALSANRNYCSSLTPTSRCTQERYILQRTPLTGIEHSLQRSVSQNACVDLFLQTYLPKGYQGPPNIPSCSTAGWIVAACTAGHNYDGKYDMLKLSVIACTLSMIGFEQGDDRLLREGLTTYGRALLQLSEGLRSINDDSRLVLIRTTRMLTLFELYFGSHNQCNTALGQAWSNHNNGERCLLLSSGASMYQRGEAHELFVDGRLHLTTKSLFRKKASELGQWQWKTLPWAGRTKTPKDLLLDLLVEIPWLFETIDRIRNGDRYSGTRDLLKDLIQNYCRLNIGLASWYNTTGSDIESKVMLAIEDDENEGSVELLASAQLISLYWCCILLTMELKQAAPELQEALRLAQIPMTHQPQDICRDVLEIMSMFLSPRSSWFGLNLAACPLLLVRSYIQRQQQLRLMDEETYLLARLLQTVKGKILAAFIQSATWSHTDMLPIPCFVTNQLI